MTIYILHIVCTPCTIIIAYWCDL